MELLQNFSLFDLKFVSKSDSYVFEVSDSESDFGFTI